MSARRSAARSGSRPLVGILLLLGISGCGESAAPNAAVDAPDEAARLLIIGQDLGAIRGYMASDCCPRPDGLTAYVDFYDILKEADFGGLGINVDGDDAGFEFDWGAGPVSAYRTATEFGIDGIAIGLSIKENEHPGDLRRLVDGKFDAEIEQLARFCKQISGPVYLRIGYEFDGAWNHGYGNNDLYIGAFRRIVDVLREQQVGNVQFVWQASASTTDDVIDGGHEDISRWYPGDDYVDWMSLSWFMNPHETVSVSTSYQPKTPLELTQEVLELARRHGKPVMIAEAAPQAMDLDQNFMAHHATIWDGEPATGRVDMSDDEIWDHWFAPLFELLEQNRDVIYALAYINADWDSQAMWGEPYAEGFWGDSRLEVNAVIADRFTRAIDAWRAGP